MTRLLNFVRIAYFATVIFVIFASIKVGMSDPIRAVSLSLTGIALLTAITCFLWESRWVAQLTAIVSIVAALLSWEPIRGFLGI